MKPYDATTNPFGPAASAADPNGLPYLAANVTYSSDPDGAGPLQAGDTIAPPTKEISVTLDSGQTVKIGFVGTVTPDLNSLESPANLAGIHVDNEADTITAINHYADQLKADGDKIVVLLTHEGAASTDCSSMLGSGSSFAQELNGLNDNVDAVLSGHTHLEYSCSFPVAGMVGPTDQVAPGPAGRLVRGRAGPARVLLRHRRQPGRRDVEPGRGQGSGQHAVQRAGGPGGRLDRVRRGGGLGDGRRADARQARRSVRPGPPVRRHREPRW